LVGWDGPLARKLPPPPPPDSTDDAFRIRLEWANAVLDVMARLHLLSARDTASISAWRSSSMIGLGFKDKNPLMRIKSGSRDTRTFWKAIRVGFLSFSCWNGEKRTTT
jgi:hypothetical protein